VGQYHLILLAAQAAAEEVFRHMVQEAGCEQDFEIDSAGSRDLKYGRI